MTIICIFVAKMTDVTKRLTEVEKILIDYEKNRITIDF